MSEVSYAPTLREVQARRNHPVAITTCLMFENMREKKIFRVKQNKK
jgi:hypothetical protein